MNINDFYEKSCRAFLRTIIFPFDVECTSFSSLNINLKPCENGICFAKCPLSQVFLGSDNFLGTYCHRIDRWHQGGESLIALAESSSWNIGNLSDALHFAPLAHVTNESLSVKSISTQLTWESGDFMHPNSVCSPYPLVF